MDTLNILTLNATILLSMGVIYSLFIYKYESRKILHRMLLGTFIGIIGILLMSNSITVLPGVIFDTRSILIGVSGLFLGFIPTIIGASIIILFRIAIGGAGIYMGIAVTIVTAAGGLVWRKYRIEKIFLKTHPLWLEFYVFGFLDHLLMLVCMLLLPKDVATRIFSNMVWPIIIIYPVATMLLCVVINNSYKIVQTNQQLEKSEKRFKTIFEQSPIGIALINDRNILYTNFMFEKILRRSKEELIGLKWVDNTHPDDFQQDLELFASLQAGEINKYNMEKRYILPDGSFVWVNMIIANINDKLGNYICMIHDISETVAMREGLINSSEEYKNLYLEYEKKQNLLISLLDSIPDLIFYKDFDGVYLGCNNAFEKFAGKKREELIGLTDFDMFDKETAMLFRNMDTKMMKQKVQRQNEEYVPYPDGTMVYLDTLKTPLYDQSEEVIGLIGVSRDITERKEREEEIIYLNYHDVLTGLYNRAFFEEEKKRLYVKGQMPISIIVGDINGLKLINDAFGHAEGDKLLIEMGKILQQCCREEDILARMGGDEFSILLPKTSANEALKIYDRIIKLCEEYANSSNKETYYLNISLGYSTKLVVEDSFEVTIREAEESMYRRKLLELKSFHSTIVSTIKTTMFEKSNETEEHAERIAVLSKELGMAIGVSDEELIILELVSTLHDIGKISVDQKILTKPGKLNDEEWAQMKKHPEVGYRIAQSVPELRQISQYILCHHERWDGKGYPQGLKGEAIPLLARILSLADSYDAMTNDRSYKKGMSEEEAIIEIEKKSGTQFDPIIANTFIEKVLKKSNFQYEYDLLNI